MIMNVICPARGIKRDAVMTPLSQLVVVDLVCKKITQVVVFVQTVAPPFFFKYKKRTPITRC